MTRRRRWLKFDKKKRKKKKKKKKIYSTEMEREAERTNWIHDQTKGDQTAGIMGSTISKKSVKLILGK
jgi:hypothetical protein